MSNRPTLAIFGATGGCISSTLSLALSAGYEVNCLVRTPSKLADISKQYPSLHIIQGDISSLPSIKMALIAPRTGKAVDIIVSGVGMAMQMKGLGFTSSQPHICEETLKNILAALKELEAEGKINQSSSPRMVMISTTGISDRGRDVPLAMIPLYHWMLGIPHADKKRMEELAIASGRPFVLVRPSFLGNGQSKGLEKVRVGVEIPGKSLEVEGVKEVGYVINRVDVGKWIFEECIAGVSGNAAKWDGKIVSLTY